MKRRQQSGAFVVPDAVDAAWAVMALEGSDAFFGFDAVVTIQLQTVAPVAERGLQAGDFEAGITGFLGGA